MKTAVITGLWVYPVKSLRGIQTDETELTVRGLKYDRNWMITNEYGDFLTQRDVPAMATIKVTLSENGLSLHYGEESMIYIPYDYPGVKTGVQIWGDNCYADDQGPEAAQWLTKMLGSWKGSGLRLVKIRDDFRRPVDPKFVKKGEAHTAFADGFPFLVTNEASLGRLNDNLITAGAEPVTMDRFRPNIILKGMDAFEEDHIRELKNKVAGYKFSIRKPCKRCKIITTDQQSGEIPEPKEPLRTLADMNTIPEQTGAFFGQNAILTQGAGTKIQVGDQIQF